MIQIKILISFLIFIILMVIIFNNKQYFNVQCKEKKKINLWEPYGASHNDCINKCYEETDQHIHKDIEADKKTQVDIKDDNGKFITGFNLRKGDVSVKDELIFSDDKESNRLNGRSVDIYLDNIWDSISERNKENNYSKCFKKCFDCSVTQCDFKKKSFKKMNKNILLNVVPENKKITLIWKLNDIEVNDVEKFIITIKETANSDIIKTIDINTDKTKKIYNYVIDNLLNNVSYVVNVNCIFKDGTIMHSNSLDVTPSEISVVNFSELKDLRKLKQTRNESFLEMIKGKLFNIEIS